VQEGRNFDPRHYHLGVVDSAARPKLLARALARGGVAEAAAIAELATPGLLHGVRPVAVVGGAGFIGSNLARSFLDDGSEVLVLDSLARPGVETNLAWLREAAPQRVHPVIADVRDKAAVEAALADASAVFHFAAQTAVTTSLDDPLDDFSVNAQGTLHVLEAIRRSGRATPLVFSSTNKVYGGLDDIEMLEAADRYLPADAGARQHGIGEERPLDFCTPYGCSKGVADQYVLDYAHSYGIPSAVLRMSCIYGPRQFGTEDQGWVAHFLLRALAGEPITIYGDGKQVRDILEVSDAVAAYRGVLAHIDELRGTAFNLGGGTANAISLKMLLTEIGAITGRPVAVTQGEWRQGDQLYFVADSRRLRQAIGWQPQVEWRRGVRRLAGWLAHNRLPAAATQPQAQRLMA
jgi:CDP-paratose 2-epimerase